MRGEYDVPAGVASENLGQHLLVALVSCVADAHAELGFECRNRFGRYVGRPVVDVEPRTRVARAPGEAGHSEEEGSPVHASRTRSEIRMMMPNSTVMSDEMALITGLAPRRAIA